MTGSASTTWVINHPTSSYYLWKLDSGSSVARGWAMLPTDTYPDLKNVSGMALVDENTIAILVTTSTGFQYYIVDVSHF